jgi:hypothetical protein
MLDPHIISPVEVWQGVHAIAIEEVVSQPKMSRFMITIDVALMQKRQQRWPPLLEECSWLHP